MDGAVQRTGWNEFDFVERRCERDSCGVNDDGRGWRCSILDGDIRVSGGMVKNSFVFDYDRTALVDGDLNSCVVFIIC